jgi:hypothetical protein
MQRRSPRPSKRSYDRFAVIRMTSKGQVLRSLRTRQDDDASACSSAFISARMSANNGVLR